MSGGGAIEISGTATGDRARRALQRIRPARRTAPAGRGHQHPPTGQRRCSRWTDPRQTDARGRAVHRAAPSRPGRTAGQQLERELSPERSRIVDRSGELAANGGRAVDRDHRADQRQRAVADTSACAPTGAMQPASSVASRRARRPPPPEWTRQSRDAHSRSVPGGVESADRHSTASAPCAGAGSITSGLNVWVMAAGPAQPGQTGDGEHDGVQYRRR